MRCPECKGDTTVKDSRASRGNSWRRRRQCLACGGLFTTYERVASEECVARVEFQRVTEALQTTARQFADIARGAGWYGAERD